jgi:anti-sigma28 factor (negative regulator of flagellin synthesis)
MRTISLEVYSAKELKEQHPDAFQDAHERFQQRQHNSGLDYEQEMVDSLKALIELGGYKLGGYSLGGSYCRGNNIEINERDCDELLGKRAFAWLENNILSKLRDKKGQLDAIKLTGYCFDCDLVEALQKSIREGSTIREAFKSLAHTFAEQVDREWEDQTSEEAFLSVAKANEWQFLKNGRRL